MIETEGFLSLKSLCKLFSFDNEIAEEFMEEADLDIYFYHNILTSLSPSIEKYVLAKSLTKSLLHQNCSNSAIWNYSSVLSSKKIWKSPKGDSILWWTACSISRKPLIKRASVYKFHYWNTKLILDLQGQKTISLFNAVKTSLNIQLDKFVYCSDLEALSNAFFPLKTSSYMALNLFLQKLSTLTIAKLTTSTETHSTF